MPFLLHRQQRCDCKEGQLHGVLGRVHGHEHETLRQRRPVPGKLFVMVRLTLEPRTLALSMALMMATLPLMLLRHRTTAREASITSSLRGRF